jgi:hypothetical protein
MLALGVGGGEAHAEVLVRWDLDQIPPLQALGVSTVVVPAVKAAAIRQALAQGYRVLVELDAAEAGSFQGVAGAAGVIVNGAVSPERLSQLEKKLGGPGFSVRGAEVRGKWPHIRTNWVTRNKDVLQVTSRSSQPWLENNEALVRIAGSRDTAGASPLLLTYAWQPVTVADLDQGPRLENYLVAIAEAGSFGADLLLPLHERFERALVLGNPDARADWAELRTFIEFYAWNAPIQRQPVANVGVVSADPMRSFEVLNLLARHNLPFRTIAPAAVAAEPLTSLDLLIVLDGLDAKSESRIAEFANAGGTVLMAGTGAVTRGAAAAAAPWRGSTGVVKAEGRTTYAVGKGRVVEAQAAPADPNTFALEMRQYLGSERRIVDVWNGITVLIAPYAQSGGDGGLLLTAVNYAAQPLPIQVRVRGTFSEVQFEAPGQRAVLLPFEQRNGGTEFVLPALRIGARVFLNRLP